MLRFDWQAFVKQHRISYTERGSNVARNHINVRCPFCGGSDPSHHMGLCIDVGHPVWGCFRDNRHRGANPVWLVMRLLGCSLAAAKEIVDKSEARYSDDMASAVAGLRADMRNARHVQERWADGERAEASKCIRMPKEIKPIDGRGYSGKFLDYLRDRGFQQPYLPVDKGDLHYAVAGSYRYRLIFPVRLGGQLVTFTGRDISGQSELRYKTPPIEEEAIEIKRCLYNEETVAIGGDTLFITEGPMDALKLNCYLQPGFAATCFFGMPTNEQILKLVGYSLRWHRLCALLDANAKTQQIGVYYGLKRGLPDMVWGLLPQDVKDPGELTPCGVRKLASRVLH